MSRIGVYDSGVGGLTVLNECLALPHTFLYLGDSARAPYGTKGKETITRYALECGEFLKSKEIEYLVVACNTVSSFSLLELEKTLQIPVIGTIKPALSVVRTHKDLKRIGIIGTEATIRGGAYERGLLEIDATLKIHKKACPLFVPLVEHGFLEGEIPQKIIEHYLKELKGNVDALILGCTHYPLLKCVIKEYLGSDVLLIDCAVEIGRTLKKDLADTPTTERELRFFVTDDTERFSFHSERFLVGQGVRNFLIEQVVL